MHRAGLRSIIAHGEGALIAKGIVSSEIRQLAYIERHVLPEELVQLEAVATELQYVILFAPHSLPCKTYLTQVRD